MFLGFLKERMMSCSKDEHSNYPERLRKEVSASALTANASVELLKEYSNAIRNVKLSCDLHATLVCKKISNGSSGNWCLTLTEIYGDKINYLLGHSLSETETLPIEKIIPAEIQKTHADYVDSILNEGKKSPYWTILFNGMMRRTIKISTAQRQSRFVKILMELDDNKSIEKELYVFNVTFFDETIPNIIAEKAAGITHDARGLIEACKNISEPLSGFTLDEFVSLSPSELKVVYEKHQQSSEQRKDILNVCLDLFKPSRGDFMPKAVLDDAIAEDTNKINQTPQEVIDFLNKISPQYQVKNGQRCNLNYSGTMNTPIERRKIDALKRFLLNLIKNAIEAAATEVSISFAEQENELVCEISDDGKGMDSELAQRFFSRKLPETRAEKDGMPVTANRKEGTLLVYKSWESLGGTAEVKSNYKPTTFKLAINRASTFFKETEMLTKAQITNLDHFFASSEVKCTFLLVDDTPMQLKFLAQVIREWRKITEKSSSDVLRNITDWQTDAVRMENISQCGIIYAANGGIALDLIKRDYPITAVITDYSMPGMNGIQLLDAIDKFQKKRHNQTMHLALHTSDDESHFSIQERNILKDIEIPCLPKSNKKQIMAFLDRFSQPYEDKVNELRI